MLRELCRRSSQYTSNSSLKVAIGTYNVNGGKHFRSVVYKDVSLSDWLLDSYDIAQEKCNKLGLESVLQILVTFFSTP